LTIPTDRTALWYHLLDFNLVVFTVFFLLLVGTLNFAASTSVTFLLLDIAFTLGSDCCSIPIDRGSRALKPT
jgi:succinate-acetate transporter protein